MSHLSAAAAEEEPHRRRARCGLREGGERGSQGRKQGRRKERTDTRAPLASGSQCAVAPIPRAREREPGSRERGGKARGPLGHIQPNEPKRPRLALFPEPKPSRPASKEPEPARPPEPNRSRPASRRPSRPNNVSRAELGQELAQLLFKPNEP